MVIPILLLQKQLDELQSDIRDFSRVSGSVRPYMNQHFGVLYDKIDMLDARVDRLELAMLTKSEFALYVKKADEQFKEMHRLIIQINTKLS